MALSDWSLCWLNSVCVSYVNMGLRRRAFSGPLDRPIMFESCRMHLTVARSQCLTGDAPEGGIFFYSSMPSYNLCWIVFFMSTLLQYHRRPHSGIPAKAVHTGASRAYNPILQIHTVSLLCSASYQG